MTNLTSLYLDDNRLAQLPALAALHQLKILDLGLNNLTSVTLPHTLTNLQHLELRLNPLTILVLPEILANNALSNTVNSLAQNNITIQTYPIPPHLELLPLPTEASLQISILGPPALYSLHTSTNLTQWSPLITLSNTIGSATTTIPIRSSSVFIKASFTP
jgi:hypothetical protein